MDNQPVEKLPKVPEISKQNSLYTVFKFVAIGTGIIGIGFIIAFLGLILTKK
jgi:preprotein translocase subunit Sss1